MSSFKCGLLAALVLMLSGCTGEFFSDRSESTGAETEATAENSLPESIDPVGPDDSKELPEETVEQSAPSSTSKAPQPVAPSPSPQRPAPAPEPAVTPPVSTAPSEPARTPEEAPASESGRDLEPEPAPPETSTTPTEPRETDVAPPRAPELPEILEVEVAAGTILELELLTPLDSSVQRVDDEIQARTISPIFVKGEEVLAAGAYVEGRVTQVQSSGRVKGRARLAFTFDRLSTRTGVESIRTSYVEREAESGEKKDAAIIGGAAGIGAIVGGIIGGKKGAAIGASVGGAGGTGVVLTTPGEEIRLPVGTEINVRLDEAVVIQLN